MRAKSQPDQVLFKSEYNGAPILLLALWETQQLRPDIVRLLENARSLNMFVVAVNASKLSNPLEYAHVIDCYIERSNFGRDFGSYQSGFKFIYSWKTKHTIPRLILANDSIYYVSRNIGQMLQNHIDTSMEVLGATENFEIQHHLGSFFISMSGNIVCHNLLRNFWATYRNSDVRPIVIHDGEKVLTTVLRQAVSAPENIGCQFSVHAFEKWIKASDENLDCAVSNLNQVRNHWRTISPKEIYLKVIEHFGADTDVRTQTRAISDGKQLRTAIYEQLNIDTYGSNIETHICRLLLENFVVGSQIHSNQNTLLEMGIGILKLDGIYRGVMTYYDVLISADKLSSQEREEYLTLVMAKGFGIENYHGRDYIAFNHGFI